MRKSSAFKFMSKRGEPLAGIMDMPGGPVRLYGVFGPCFTCPKESHGAAKICRALASLGIAMLRFDVAGFGMSGGNVADANFTTRIEDLVAAAQALPVPPRLLMGHSISGTAALSAAKFMPSVELVATVGSPADPAAVIDKFRKGGLMTEKGDMVEVSVLGKPYTFKKSFIDDMLSQTVAEDTAGIGRKLLVFHAPHDDIVLYKNAEVIAGRAGTYAELVTLDDAATHLFEKRDEDAVAVVEKISGWFN